jgi:hypothetical protein
MLHLALVQKNEDVGGGKLQLLARQQSDHCWAVINPESTIVTDTNSLHEGLLVLVDLSDHQEVNWIKPAQDWVLMIIQEYLIHGITPSFFKEEVARTEEWRRDLTSQSQDLTRQRAEFEARRDGIRATEQELEQQKQRLERMAEQLRERESELKQERRRLEELEEHLRAKEAE